MNDKKELLDVFRKLDPVNQADMLAHIQVAYAAQENTKKYYKDPPESVPVTGEALVQAGKTA